MSSYTGYVSFPWAAHIHGEDSHPAACWPLPKGAKHRRGTPSVSSYESLDTYVSSKVPSTGRGSLSVLKVHSPEVVEMDAATCLQIILEKDAKAQISFIKDTLPAFAASVRKVFVAAIPFRTEPEPMRPGLSNLLYLWDADREED